LTKKEISCRLELLEELPLTPVHKVDKQALKEDIAQKLKAEKGEDI
jgi:non-ribosomal peptide synthetase component E (peptide arylation enzyme)